MSEKPSSGKPKMLTDTAFRNAAPREKPYKLTDGLGLFMLVNPNGSKWWRIKYRFAGKEQLLSLGTYPEVGLKEARERRDEIRKELAQGINPSQKRKAEKEADPHTFEATAREWHAKFSPKLAPEHAKRVLRRMEADIFPWLGKTPIADIKPRDLLACLRRIEDRGAIDTAHRALQNCGQVFRYAIATGRAERDVSADLRGALPPARGKHFASVIDGTDDPRERERRIAVLLRKLEGYEGTLITRVALMLSPLVFVRPGELATMRWADIDLDTAEWRYTSSKKKIPHMVPLARQALALLHEIQPLTGRGEFVFPGARDSKKPMSSETVRAAMRRLGIGKDDMTAHGFRAIARTMLDEVAGFRVDLIEQQLAHAVKDANGRAYNRTAHRDARHQMMQTWADYLDRLKKGES